MSSSSNSKYKCINLSCSTRTERRDFHLQSSFYPKFCQYCGAKLEVRHQYRILKFLGEGGFALTFLAEDKANGRQVAIKQLIDNPKYLGKDIELFKREAKKLAELGSHPQIPTFYDYFTQPIELHTSGVNQDYSYLVLEFINGQNLLQELEDKGTYSEQQIQDFLQEILPVLEFVHLRGNIHRDIKPENIMRREGDSGLVLIDFGGIKEFTQTNLSRKGTEIFTPGYAPNEQKNGKTYPASDLYSLGVTCIHLLTGSNPEDIFDTIEDKLLWKEELSKKKIKISEHMKEVLVKLLETTVKKRYQTSNEVLRDILPKVNIDEYALELKANNQEKQFIKTITVKNLTPNTKLKGSWEVVPHPNDKNVWIKFVPEDFECGAGQSYKSKVIVDTTGLAREKKFKRTIRLTTNAYTEIHEINIEVKTAQIVSQIKILPLLSKLLILTAVCFVACICAVNSTYLTKIFTDTFQAIWNHYVYNYLMKLKDEYIQSVGQ